MHLIHPHDQAIVDSAFARTYATPGLQPPVAFRLATKEGGWLHVEAITNNQLEDPEIGGIVVNVHDVTTQATSLYSLMRALGRATDNRDPYTSGHQLKVAGVSREIGTRLGLDSRACEVLALGASIHDIGKNAIPAEILTKPSKLSFAEQTMMRSHPEVGLDILEGIDLAEPVRDVVQVLAAFTSTNDDLVGALDLLDDAGWSTVAESPVGHVPIRFVCSHALWDSWVHERDIMLPLGLPLVVEPDEGGQPPLHRRARARLRDGRCRSELRRDLRRGGHGP